MVMWIDWEDGGWGKDGIGEGMELLGIVVLVELIFIKIGPLGTPSWVSIWGVVITTSSLVIVVIIVIIIITLLLTGKNCKLLLLLFLLFIAIGTMCTFIITFFIMTVFLL